MKRSQLVLSVFILLLIYPAAVNAQLWNGVISPSRAADWSQVGIPGGLPDTNWTQCGSTIAAYSGSASTINSALSSCAGQSKYVLLGPGSFNLTSSISFPSAGHVVLRGSGATQTFINAPASGVGGCQLGTSMICIQSSDQTYTSQPPPTITAWTAGYTQGSNQITLASTSGIRPSNPTVLVLEQCETGYSATSATAACTGAARDNGQLFVCADLYNASGPTGCSNNGPGNENAHRGQTEYTVATAVNGNVVTIANPLRYPNWSTGQTPRVWFFQPIVQVGVENLSIDNTANGANDLVQFFNAYQWWVSGCRFSNWARWAVEAFQVTNGIVKDSYWYHSTGSDSYGIRFEIGSNNLIQNNIITQTFAPVVFDGASSGNVVAYNYIMNDNYSSDYMRGSTFEHDVNAYDLYEGNAVNQILNDGNHGTANMMTRFRNFALGWDSCGNGQCGSSAFKDSSTTAIYSASYGRYENNIANVVGMPGYHTGYKGTNANSDVFTLGQLNAAPNDPLVSATALMWGNYDVITATVRWCGNSSNTGWGSTCASTTEVPTSASTYPNAVPAKGDTTAGQPALPPSFYLSSKPAWFGSLPWPAIGPDVTGGNIGICSGVLNTIGKFSGLPATSGLQCLLTSLTTPAWGGHVNTNPAMNCYLNVMGGRPDGTGSILAFDPKACYGGSSVSTGPAAPTSLFLVINTN